MTISDLYIIHDQKNVIVTQKSDTYWIFEVKKNGLLRADFLQFEKSLKVDILLQENGASCFLVLVDFSGTFKLEISIDIGELLL